MCGIIGIISKKEVADELYCGLTALQHRGQDAAGITTFDGEFRVVKDVGLVRDVFKKEDILKLTGRMGIGHARYPTTGSTLKTDAQPFFTPYPCLIAMCHNGNLVNYKSARKMVEDKYKGVVASRCDVEIILRVFSYELAKQKTYGPEDIFKATKQTMSALNGSYSVVGLMKNGLFAFRDPHGIKPLVLAKKDDAYAFASETSTLDILGYKIERDVAPGEVVFVSDDLKVFSQKVVEAAPAHCMFEWVYFARPDSVIENKDVYEVRLRLGTELAKNFRKKYLNADVVVPVPDSSRPAAVGFSDETGIPFREGLVKGRYMERTFIMPSQKEREYAMRLKLNPIIREVKGKKIAVIDDSLVRGTTSAKIVNLLKKAGAREVHLLLTCPEIKFPCFYGIDMATRKELLAAQKSVEEIREYIGADSLTYQTIESLKNAIGLPLCTACLDRKYPTGISQKDFEESEAQREKERNL